MVVDPVLTGVSSYAAPGGRSGRRRVHTCGTGTADGRCVYGNDASARRSGRISIRIPPSCSGTVFHLVMQSDGISFTCFKTQMHVKDKLKKRSYRCGFGDAPSNASSWCRSCRSRHRCRCATQCASSARCVALAWVWTPLDPAGRTEESEEPVACWVACPWRPRTCQTGAAPCRGSAFERKPEASDGKPAEILSGAGGSHPDSTEASCSPWPVAKRPVWVARKTSCMKRCPLV